MQSTRHSRNNYTFNESGHIMVSTWFVLVSRQHCNLYFASISLLFCQSSWLSLFVQRRTAQSHGGDDVQACTGLHAQYTITSTTTVVAAAAVTAIIIVARFHLHHLFFATVSFHSNRRSFSPHRSLGITLRVLNSYVIGVLNSQHDHHHHRVDLQSYDRHDHHGCRRSLN